MPSSASTVSAGLPDPAVAALIAKARQAQAIAERYTQARVDEVVAAAAWAILEPSRNQALAELAVKDTGVGNVKDKISKNYRKTLGLLRDLHGRITVGVISQDEATGMTEIARPVGVVAAITPSTNPGATPANKIINALKARNAVIVAPSPKGWSTCALLLRFMHEQLDRIGAPRELVQCLPHPVTKEATAQLMAMADLVVATGSQANVRAAARSGTPAFGVGAGNVAAIVDETADVALAAEKIVASKTFDNATSCSSENSLVVVASQREALLAALGKHGAMLVDAAGKERLAAQMWPEGKLSATVIGQSAAVIAQRAGLGAEYSKARVLLVDEIGCGEAYPFSGEKLSPVLTVYTVPDFAQAKAKVSEIYAFQGAGHSVSLHSTLSERALELGLELPVSRVIVNQVHCVATGGAFDNALPFSLSMGCGTWGKNNFSENMNVRHYMNITRVVRPIALRMPNEDDLLAPLFASYGR
jgi:sulfoacetaldehyde dehydrogenase